MMRKGEITPELIELSKRARRVGFPQNIRPGDWIIVGGQSALVTAMTPKEVVFTSTRPCYTGGIPDSWARKPRAATLILSFSRCLAWLREHQDYDVVTVNPNTNPHVDMAEGVLKILVSNK